MPKRASRRVPHGGLTEEVMAGVWKLGEATVEDVRSQLSRPDLAYTTVHTVLNRLVHRGLIERERDGGGQVYRPKLQEAEYIARSFNERLTASSPTVRDDALRALVDRLDADQLEAVAHYANRIHLERSKS